MRARIVLTVVVCSAVGLGASAFAAAPSTPARAGGARAGARQVLGLRPVLLAGARDLGVAPSRTEHVTLALALRDRAGLDALIARRGAKGITPAQFQARFGPTASTVRAARDWARHSGLAVTGVTGTLVSLSGPTASFGRALGTSTHVFRAGTTTYRSLARPAALPASLASAVVSVTGLSDAGGLRLPGAVRAAAPATGAGFGPKELTALYGAQATQDVTGQTVGVIAEGDLGQVQKDLKTFASTFGLPQVPVTVVGPGSKDASGQDEFDLDTQYATSQAPGAALRIYDGASLADDDILKTINLWVQEATVKSASFSAGECELLAQLGGLAPGLDQVLAQAAAQGQTLFVSSGDNGGYCSLLPLNGVPAGLPGVEYPASSPYAVAVGGTTVGGIDPVVGTTIPLPGVGETTWYGSGGGLSLFEPKPAYQTSPLPLRRGVPDVALDADPATGFKVIVSGKQLVIGGTSASAPAWNGFWTRALAARGPLGFAGPRLYRAKAGFRDVVVGTNGLFPALPGYDYTTGLGTPDLARLVPAL